MSVGMISEGTDIPRLQVCCHLSHIRTEMHFRQILGRILRINDAPNQESWLFTFAEASLTQYAIRLQIDIPDMDVNFESLREKADEEDSFSIPNDSVKSSEDLDADIKFAFDDDDSDTVENEVDLGDFDDEGVGDAAICDFELHEERFIEQLVGLYNDEVFEAV